MKPLAVIPIPAAIRKEKHRCAFCNRRTIAFLSQNEKTGAYNIPCCWKCEFVINHLQPFIKMLRQKFRKKEKPIL